MKKKTVFGLVVAVSFAALVPTVVALASSTSTVKEIACVGVVVNAREISLDAGLGTYVKASTAAYAARAKALKKAYATTTYDGAHAAAQAAWAAFGTSFDSAVANWTAVKSSTWSRFDTSILTCKAPTSTSDAADVVSGF